MNNSHDIGAFDSFTPKSTSIFNKFGNKLGSVFVSAKKAATKKYIEVTKGINERIEAEDERIQAEIFAHLEEQAEEFEQETRRLKKRWFFVSSLLIVLSFIGGAVSTFFYMIK